MRSSQSIIRNLDFLLQIQLKDFLYVSSLLELEL